MFKTFLSFFLLTVASVSFGATLTPIDKFNHVKVIGHWMQYNIYDVDNADLALVIPPFAAGDIMFQDNMDLADAITPIDAADVNQHGVKCDFLCVNPNNQVIGYNPIAYAQTKAMYKKLSKQQKK